MSKKIGNGWVEAEDVLEEVKGPKVGRSESQLEQWVKITGIGEIDGRKDGNEARRAGD